MSARTSTGGRPLQFVPEDVLERAMRLFWERGFEATSLQDLEARTGLSRSSLYNSFGSKRGLFKRAIDEYGRRGETVFMRLERGERGLQDIHDFIEHLAAQRGARPMNRGCLMVNSMIEFGGEDLAVARSGKRYFGRVRAAFTAALRRAAKLGEIAPAGVDQRARLLLAIAMGINVEARAGATRAELAALAAAARRQIDDWRLKSPARESASRSGGRRKAGTPG